MQHQVLDMTKGREGSLVEREPSTGCHMSGVTKQPQQPLKLLSSGRDPATQTRAAPCCLGTAHPHAKQRARCTEAKASGGRWPRGQLAVTRWQSPPAPRVPSSAEDRAAGGLGGVPGTGRVLRAACLSSSLLPAATGSLTPSCSEARRQAEGAVRSRGESGALSAHPLVALPLRTCDGTVTLGC